MLIHFLLRVFRAILLLNDVMNNILFLLTLFMGICLPKSLNLYVQKENPVLQSVTELLDHVFA